LLVTGAGGEQQGNVIAWQPTAGSQGQCPRHCCCLTMWNGEVSTRGRRVDHPANGIDHEFRVFAGNAVSDVFIDTVNTLRQQTGILLVRSPKVLVKGWPDARAQVDVHQVRARGRDCYRQFPETRYLLQLRGLLERPLRRKRARSRAYARDRSRQSMILVGPPRGPWRARRCCQRSSFRACDTVAGWVRQANRVLRNRDRISDLERIKASLSGLLPRLLEPLTHQPSGYTQENAVSSQHASPISTIEVYLC
jgi:hypothetical protein